jgi:hypothetical protein
MKNIEVVDKYNRLNLPKDIMFNGNRYTGEAIFINGYNGYDSNTVGILCALINGSVLDK